MTISSQILRGCLRVIAPCHTDDEVLDCRVPRRLRASSPANVAVAAHPHRVSAKMINNVIRPWVKKDISKMSKECKRRETARYSEFGVCAGPMVARRGCTRLPRATAPARIWSYSWTARIPGTPGAQAHMRRPASGRSALLQLIS